MPKPDAKLLATVGGEADIFACDAPTFARLVRSVLYMDCPAERMPLYQIGLHPKLHTYRGPTRMPNRTEHVTAYCRHPEAAVSACERVGREHKPSNRAAIRRQCPAHSHGWVLDVAVENRRQKAIALKARHKRRQWQKRRADGASAGGTDSTLESSRRRRRAAGKAKKATEGLGLNVLLLMLDSISAARFIRGMPITHALLESWMAPDPPPTAAAPPSGTSISSVGTHARRRRRSRTPASSSNVSEVSGGWRSFRFDYFTVVGSNSPRNQFPMLSGYTSTQWARDHGGKSLECIVPGFDDGVRASKNHACDKWVFDAYREAGYVTNFETNMCDWGVMEEVYPFDTLHPPTDHHLMEPWCHVDYDVDKLYFRPMTRCLGGRPAHEPLMKYERDFLRSYAPLPRLSWSVYLEGHEPSFRAMANLDADLAAHLVRLRAAHGERTAILLVSDHGIHYGKYYDGARAGPREHTLPLFYALFPRATLAQRPTLSRALCINQRRLVSPFDVHATLLHLLSYPHAPALPDWSDVPSPMRPRSLLEEVPAARRCDEAGIPPEACGTCAL